MTVQEPGAGVSKSRLAYDWIRERIVGGSFTPGYRLVLGPLAAQLGISQVPVREAIRLLEAEGLVSFERNVGAQVAMLHPAEYVHTMQTLGLLEGYATALSAPHLGEGELDAATALNDRMSASLTDFDPADFTRLNRQFHTVLFSRCPNPHLVDLVDREWARLSSLRESTFGFVPGRPSESVAEHADILELVRTGADPAAVEEAARAHRLRTLDAFLERQNTESTITEDPDAA
jgi:DNA-binding GntR family transcriptional regulator